MALTYVIKNYETDVDDSSKTMVGFKVTDEAGGLFLIDKKIKTLMRFTLVILLQKHHLEFTYIIS